MPPKKHRIDETKDEKFVFVLSYKTFYHSGDPQDPEVVGVYVSKAAAVAASGKIPTFRGTFDRMIDGDFRDHYIDNRKNPPDNGCLLKVGDQDYGEGDYEELIIQKFPLQEEATTGPKKRAK